MASRRTVFDLLSPRKKPKPSPSPLASPDGASLPSYPLLTNNPTASPNLPTLLIGPCSAGDRTTSINPSSGCFSVVGEIQEKGSDGNVIPSSSVASDSGSFFSDDKGSVCENQKGDLPLDGTTIENPSCDFLIENDGGFGLGAEISLPISDDQRKRIDINRSFARAKRNLNICIERVSKARAEGLGSFKLEELLVEETWMEALPGEFQKPYMKNLCRFVEWRETRHLSSTISDL